MKPAKTLIVSILAAGLASAQSPMIIQNTRDRMNGVNDRATASSNEALGVHDTVPSAASVRQAAKSSGAVSAAPAKASVAGNSADAKTSKVKISAAKAASAKPSVAAKRAPHAAAVKGSAPVKAAAAVVPTAPPATTAAVPAPAPESAAGDTEQPVVPDSKNSANGRRDPFISPVVSHAGGSGCSTGKKCLEIGAINLRGVVHAESGFIAVVSNGLNKAYFLRENDPVFNGYVVKITGDSIVFQETLQDRLGKSFTREVTKKITTPAV